MGGLVMPLRAVLGNLAWSHDGNVWAMWRIDPAAYRYSSAAERVGYARGVAAMLRALRGEPLILGLCGRVGAFDTVRRGLQGLSADRHPLAIEMADGYRRLLKTLDLRERSYWLALPLPHAGSLAAFGGILGGAGTQVARAFGVTPPAPSAAEVKAFAARAARVSRALPGLTPATPAEILWIHHRAPRRGTAGEPTPAATARSAWTTASWSRGRLRTPSYAAFGEVHFDEGGRAGGSPAAPTDGGTGPAGMAGMAGPVGRAASAAGRWLRGDNTAASPFSHRYLRVTTPDAGVSHQAFLALSDLPDEWTFPGGEWMASLHDAASFPIDWAIRSRIVPGVEARGTLNRKRRQVADQFSEFTPGSNEDPGVPADDLPSWALTGFQQLADEQTALDGNAAEVEYQSTIVLGVWGDSQQECEHRAEAIRRSFSDELIAVRPTGSQLDCYAQMLPGHTGGQVVADYRQFLLADDLAKAMPFVGGGFGDRSGPVLGLTVDSGLATPVQLHISSWATRDISASLGLFAELGAGKSVALKKILADVGGAGGRTIGWDRTRTREQVQFLAAAFGPAAVGVADLGAHDSDFSLDPLRVLPAAAGEAAAETLVTQLLGIDATSERGTVLAEALAAVVAGGRPSMRGLVDQLGATDDPVAVELYRQLQAAARRRGTAVVFDPDLPPLDLSTPHLVFATSGLSVPKRHELRGDQLVRLPFAQLWGRAILVLTAVIARAVAFADRRFALVHADECYWLTREGEGSPGYDVVLELIRDGRKNNAGILLAAHDPADTGDEVLLGLLSAIFVGRQRNHRLAERYVRALGVTDPDVATDLTRTITEGLSPLSHIDATSGNQGVAPGREGEFLARIHHRLGRLKVIIPPVARLDTAIRTTPDPEEALT